MKTSPKSHANRSNWILVITLATLALSGGCRRSFDKDNEQSQHQANRGPARISVINGQTILVLETSAQKALDLQVVTLATTVARQQSTLPAVVLSVQELATSRDGYVALQAQLKKSQVATDVARKEYTRLKSLFEQNQNVSEKSLQSAEGFLHANEADERAAEQQLSLQQSVVRQDWGSVVAKWTVEGSAELQRILGQREMLVQITMSSDIKIEPTKTIFLEIPGETRTRASLISTFPRVDPRIQGRSFLYVAQAQRGVAPGANLVAHLSVGGKTQGLFIPASAIVWSEGKAWVYLETDSVRFARRAVSTETPLDKGFFVTQGFSPGDRVVSQGAQALLSEELLVHRQAGGESDED